MKKKIMLAVASIFLSTITIVGLSSFTSQSENAIETETAVHAHVSCQGKHCTYTVGCDCSGFSPKTDGKEWEKSYCKRCGHHKRYHK
jgi:hypothetical protein